MNKNMESQERWWKYVLGVIIFNVIKIALCTPLLSAMVVINMHAYSSTA